MNDKQKSNTLISGAAWLALSTIILKIIGLIYKIPLSYMLGDEGMGYFNSAYTVYVFFYVIGTAGIPKAISILVAKREAETQGTGDAAFRSAFRFFFVLGLILLAIFLLGVDAFASAIGNPKATLAMYSIAPSVLFVCAGGVIRGYLSGRMRFAPIAISELISGVLKLVIGLLLARIAIQMGKSLPTVAAYTILGITVGSLISLIYLALVYSKHSQKACKHTEKGIIKDILGIAIPITLASAVASIVNILDLTVIMNGLEDSGFAPSVSNVLYGNYTTLAVPMLSLVSTLISPITTAILPMLASTHIKKGREEYSGHLGFALTVTSFLTVPAGIMFACFSPEILSVIFEESSAILGAPFLAALSPAVLLLGPLVVINTALEAAGKPTTAFISLSVGALVKLTVGVCLLKYTDLGVLSAPIGTSVSYAASYCISRISIAKMKDVKLSVFKSLAAPFIASSLSAFLTLNLLKLLDFSTTSRLSGLLCIALFGVFYLALSLTLSPKARDILFNCIKMNKKRTNHL